MEWLEAADDGSVRMVCGPIGAGKTFAVKQYVARSAGAVGYVRVPAKADTATLRALVEDVPEGQTVVLDDADRADPAAYEALIDAIFAGDLPRRIVLVGRSRRKLRADGLVARGYARACPNDILAFEPDEVERLAATYGVSATRDDVMQLLHDTDGWALASEWLVRDAAANRRSLQDAFLQWQPQNGHLLLEFVQHEGFDEGGACDAFFDALRNGWNASDSETARLDQLGMPIVRTRTGLRPYRALSRLLTPVAEAAAPDIRSTTAVLPVMTVNVFGRFRCEIAGKPVVFPRRRDQHVFAFVAMQPDCRTSRDAVLEAFWPGMNSAVAGQGLRTTLSRIRRAIADAAPSVDPQRYFETAGEIRINHRAVAIDARRFLDRIEQGRLDDVRGDIESAKHHYRVAERIYADRALAADASEPCLERMAERLERFYTRVLMRITEIYAAMGDLETARDSARKLFALGDEEARARAIASISVPSPEAAATA